MQGTCATAAVMSLVFASATARAEEAVDPAKAAYEQALARYESGDVPGALASMTESFRLSGRAELLYNIARLEEEGGECSAALLHYGEYLERVPEGQLREAAEAAKAKLAPRCPPGGSEPGPVIAATAAAPVGGASHPTPPAPPAPAPPAPAPPAPAAEPISPPPAAENDSSAHRWLGWSAIAAGAVAGVGAVYLTTRAYDARSRWSESVRAEAAGGPWADWSVLDEQHRNERWSRVLAVGSGALLGGGVLLLILGGNRTRAVTSAGLTAQVSLLPGIGSASLSGSF